MARVVLWWFFMFCQVAKQLNVSHGWWCKQKIAASSLETNGCLQAKYSISSSVEDPNRREQAPREGDETERKRALFTDTSYMCRSHRDQDGQWMATSTSPVCPQRTRPRGAHARYTK